jgi:hypothetical protein
MTGLRGARVCRTAIANRREDPEHGKGKDENNTLTFVITINITTAFLLA